MHTHYQAVLDIWTLKAVEYPASPLISIKFWLISMTGAK